MRVKNELVLGVGVKGNCKNVNVKKGKKEK